MACLRSLDIINELYILFRGECSDAWNELDNTPANRIKIPSCINIDGTVTIALPSPDGESIYVRLCGTGLAEIWSVNRGTDVFWIDESNRASEDICANFMDLLKEHGYEPSGRAALADSCYRSTVFDAAKFVDIQSKKLKTTQNKLT